MSRFLKIGEAAKYLGVSVQTLRRWEQDGYLLPDKKSAGQTRYYNFNKLSGFNKTESDLTLAYARVSSHDQKADLERQVSRLEDYCSAQGWNYEVVRDLGSGMNYRKKGLRKLLDFILEKKIKRLVLTHKDRLLRFGSEIIFSLCESKQIEVVLINQSEDKVSRKSWRRTYWKLLPYFLHDSMGSAATKIKRLLKPQSYWQGIRMQIQLAHKIKLDPTRQQDIYFRQACGIARFTWNWALAEWKRQYEEGLKPSGYALKKEFNAIKQDAFPWVYEVTKYACQQPFLFLQEAFSRFFKHLSRYPRFKKKGVNDSFYIENDHIQVKGNRIKIPKLGWVKMRESLRFSGKILSATISRIANKWFVSLQVALEEQPTACESQACVGVDLGIKQLATLFDGQSEIIIPGQKPLTRLLKKLKCEQRRLSAKRERSHNREKQRMKVALTHYRIRCIRQDSLHKLTTDLVTNYQKIAIEDLNVKGMLSNHKLARSISDMGFHEFRRQLTYKAALKGNEVHVVDRWFPSSKRCSHCFHINEKLTLRDRVFRCKACNSQFDRDVNAARNLLSTVSSTGFEACGEESAGLKQCA